MSACAIFICRIRSCKVVCIVDNVSAVSLVSLCTSDLVSVAGDGSSKVVFSMSGVTASSTFVVLLLRERVLGVLVVMMWG